MADASNGHLFIVDGNISRLQCDAWLLPTSEDYSITKSFYEAIGLPTAGRIPFEDRPGWQGELAVPHRVWNAAHPDAPRVWLGQVGGTSRTPVQHFVDCARAFVTAATADLRSARAHVDRRPLVSLPIIGTGDGGGARRRGLILQELVPELLQLTETEDVDIVLVAWGSVAYSAAIKARKDALTQPSARERQWGSLDIATDAVRELARHARHGNLVVFIGAGVSASAGLPAWQALLDGVAIRLGYDRDLLPHLHQLDVRDQAAVLAGLTHDTAALATIVEETLESSHHSLLHSLIASLPVKEVVTTNFDRMFESAAKRAGESVAVLPGGQVAPGARWLAKLHGDLGKDLVLTRGEFKEARLRNSALFGLVQALLITRHMLFIGYSLRDEDFNELIHEVRSVRSAEDTSIIGTALMPNTNPAMGKLWSDLTIISPTATAGHVVDGRVVEPTPEELRDVARWQAILLDKVASESTSDISFITNPDYNVDEGTEARLAQLIRQLRDLYESSGAGSAKWSKVAEFINHFDRPSQPGRGKR